MADKMTFPTLQAAIAWLAERNITTMGQMVALGIRIKEIK